jgi:hypothetical protein
MSLQRALNRRFAKLQKVETPKQDDASVDSDVGHNSTVYRMNADGGYSYLHPTKGWRKVAAKRAHAQALIHEVKRRGMMKVAMYRAQRKAAKQVVEAEETPLAA